MKFSPLLAATLPKTPDEKSKTETKKPKASEARPDDLAHAHVFPKPPTIPFLLCRESGDLRFLSDGAKQTLAFSPGETPFSLLPFLSEEDRCFLTSAALEGTYRFLRLYLPATLPSLSTTVFFKHIRFLSVYSSYQKALVLLGLPFYEPPLNAEGHLDRRGRRSIKNPLAEAIAAFIASRFLGRTNFVDPPCSLPWLDARVLALSFEQHSSVGMRSVGRCLRFLKRLFAFPGLFPVGKAPLIDDPVSDPFALFLTHSDSVLVLLLSLARFALDNADGERGDILFSFYFQSQRLQIDLSFPASPSLFGKQGGSAPRGKAATDVQEKIMALEDLFFPHGDFPGLPLLAQKHVLLLVLLQNLCRRFGWQMRGGIYSPPDENDRNQKKLFLQLRLPALHRKGALLPVNAERKDEECDFLRFLSFLCPTEESLSKLSKER